MYILGINGLLRDRTAYTKDDWGNHDAAAALIDEYGIHSALEEERLTRIKHTNFFPYEAIRFCLQQRQLDFENIDYIAMPGSRDYFHHVAIRAALLDPKINFMSAEDYIRHHLKKYFNFGSVPKIEFTEHHEAHAWSAWACSGFSEALILILDGDGEPNRSGLVAIGRDNRLKVIKRFSLSQSVGHMYQNLIHMIGYHRFDEYKVMGLAPYGDPDVYKAVFNKGVTLLKDGEYSILGSEEWMHLFLNEGMLTKARRHGQAFSQFHKDFSAALQAATSNIILHVLRHYRSMTGIRKLCLAGGVGHNCSANGDVYYSRLFDDVFFQPAAHDAGVALGGALEVLNRRAVSPVPHRRLEHIYLGPDLPKDSAILEELSKWSSLLSFRKVTDICRTTAKLIAEGSVIGWVQGRSEFGPRALGNRSILADPRPVENKERINKMIKKREGYRPFAPSVLEEEVGTYFEVPYPTFTSKFMIHTLLVKERYRQTLAAITHVDGSARVQTVDNSNGPYRNLINEFRNLTKIPILLNTSFNNNAEPIVDSITDAIVCFLTTGLNYLVCGDYIAEKKDEGSLDSYCALYIAIPRHRFLEKKQQILDMGPECAYGLNSNAHEWMGQTAIRLSEAAFKLLIKADGKSTVLSLLHACSVQINDRHSVVAEIKELWSERAIILSPNPI